MGLELLLIDSKMYISLEGVDQDNVQVEFKPMSLDNKIHDVQGKNYRCAIPKLHKEIVPQKCKVLVKPKRIVITMFKSSREKWVDIHHKEDKIKPSLEKERDPMARIIDSMKIKQIMELKNLKEKWKIQAEASNMAERLLSSQQTRLRR